MTEDAVADAVRGEDPERCPVLALGHHESSFYFLSRAFQVIEMRPRDFSLNGLLALFGGDEAWLKTHFAADRKKRAEIEVGAAAAYLMRACHEAGLWRLDAPRRSIGVWRDGARAVAHCGDTLYVFGEGKRQRRPLGMTKEALYLGAPPIEPPARIPATEEEAQEIFAAIALLWKFADDYAARMVLGWIVLGMLGQAPKWRVHILLKGAGGKAGKSALLRLASAMLGPQAAFVNDPTEAGLRELLTDEARTVIYDEAGTTGEGGGGGGEHRTDRVMMIVGLLRRMTGEEGARSVRGTGAGARFTTVSGSAALAAANPPILDAQDRSRILEVAMLPVEAKNKAEVERVTARAEALSVKLRARALAGFARFEANFKIYHQGLVEAGCDTRQADRVGTLLAAAAMLLEDAPVRSAGEDVQAFGDDIRRFIAEDEEMANGARCLNALMSTMIDHWKRGARSTIGRLVQIGLDRQYGASAREALPTYGLRLEFLLDGTPELWVANNHKGLERIFAGSDWRAGAWKGALEQLPGVLPGEAPRHFYGAKSRFVVVPRQYLPPKLEKPPDDPAEPL